VLSDGRSHCNCPRTGATPADAGILSIAESRHSLEDVYLELIDEDVEARAR
jgi:hypothetical protein